MKNCISVHVFQLDEHSSLQISSWTEDLKPSLIKHANNANVSKYLRNRFPFPYTVDSANSFFNLLENDKHFTSYAFTIERKGNREAIGGIGFTFKDEDDVEAHAVELGYWLSEEYWGKGIMGKCLPEFLKNNGFSTRPFTKIYAYVVSENVASSKLLEKNGFTIEGRLNKWGFKRGKFYDCILYALIK